ncbi:MAG: PEGA domain-containing protein [Thermodesulfobacteriota bacterium]
MNYSSREEPVVRTSKDVTVFVEPYKDARKASIPQTAGVINATVSDMMGQEITLDKDVSTLVTSAFMEELKSSGFKTTESAEAAAYVLTGEIREFNLDIGVRDKIKIEIQSVLKERATDKAVFLRTERVEDERFAGVSGNSRRTIADYMLKNLSKAVRKTIKEAAFAINAVPQFNGGPQDKAVFSGKGRLFVASAPERAKLYVGDIYYGLTPIAVELAPGVYDVRLKLDGYDDEKEKVSVREGSTTEFEVLFKKQ